MAYKPESIRRDRRILCPKAAARAAKTAKKASTRLARRAAKLDPESAPTGRFLKGWLA